MSGGVLGRLRIPAVAAPMTGVSGRDLVVAACRSGISGTFPVHNPRSPAELDEWMTEFSEVSASPGAGPWIPNLIVHRSNRHLDEQLATIVTHRPFAVITSVGSPVHVLADLHRAGCQVWADVASMRHARSAADAGADGLVLLSAGAGGKTGWANPLAFVRSVRTFFDGVVVLAGGIADGVALRAATTLGCDLGYLGTTLIASAESYAPEIHKRLIADSVMDDVVLSSRIDGLPASLLRDSPGLTGDEPASVERFEHGDRLGRAAALGLYSGGHGVGLARAGEPVEKIVERLAREFYAGQP